MATLPTESKSRTGAEVRSCCDGPATSAPVTLVSRAPLCPPPPPPTPFAAALCRSLTPVLVFCSFVMVVALLFGLFGTKRHNKFALTAALCTLLLGVSVTLIISVTLFVAVTPKYSKGFANE
jgi:hypothetical protein